MKTVAFLNTEIDCSQRILNIESIKCDGCSFHSNSIGRFKLFLNGTQFFYGHNNPKYRNHAFSDAGIDQLKITETLYLSLLLLLVKIYHRLIKDNKLKLDESNIPLNDSVKTRDPHQYFIRHA
jgi:ATP-dependent DNA helicase RecQ